MLPLASIVSDKVIYMSMYGLPGSHAIIYFTCIEMKKVSGKKLCLQEVSLDCLGRVVLFFNQEQLY